MREFSEAGLRSGLTAAGFSDLRFYAEDYAPFGVIRAGSADRAHSGEKYRWD